jgi:hypothetical protein
MHPRLACAAPPSSRFRFSGAAPFANTAPPRQRECRRSSVVERILGKAEVDSSILSGGTIKINGLSEKIDLPKRNEKRRGSMEEAVGREVSAVLSRICDGAGRLGRRPTSESQPSQMVPKNFPRPVGNKEPAFAPSPPSTWSKCVSNRGEGPPPADYGSDVSPKCSTPPAPVRPTVAAPRQKRCAPPALASAALATTASASISLVAATPVFEALALGSACGLKERRLKTTSAVSARESPHG